MGNRDAELETLIRLRDYYNARIARLEQEPGFVIDLTGIAGPKPPEPPWSPRG